MPTTLGRRISTALSFALVVALVTISTAARAEPGPKKGGETATALAQDSAPKPKPKHVGKPKPKHKAKAHPKAHVASKPHAHAKAARHPHRSHHPRHAPEK